jgi:hypothetical protein
MIPVELAINRFRRDLTIAALLRGGLLMAAVVCVVAEPIFGIHQDWMLFLMIVAGIRAALSYRSVQGTRMAADSPSLIAAGEFDQAESHIDAALRSFSLFRTAKIVSLHHLALLRHAQRRWRESAQLSQAVLSQGLRAMKGLQRASLLVLTDSMIQLGDMPGAYAAMNSLQRCRLSLNETLTLQLLQLDYSWRIGGWEAMLQGIGGKVQMSELMSPINAARSQALLALAAYKLNRIDLARWLRRRAELLAEPGEISGGRKPLDEMFAGPG